MKKLLENNTISLRAPEPEDIDKLYAWENDTALWEFGSAIVPISRFNLKQYLIESKQDIYVDKQLRLMVELTESEEVIGTADLYDFDPFHRRAGVGILIDKKQRNRGYGLQVLMLLENYAFDFLSLRQLYAFVPEKNLASMQLFRKANYKPTGILREWLFVDNKFEHVQVWQKIKQD